MTMLMSPFPGTDPSTYVRSHYAYSIDYNQPIPPPPPLHPEIEAWLRAQIDQWQKVRWEEGI